MISCMQINASEPSPGRPIRAPDTGGTSADRDSDDGGISAARDTDDTDDDVVWGPFKWVGGSDCITAVAKNRPSNHEPYMDIFRHRQLHLVTQDSV
jgi:hypothetical protein